MKHHGQTTSETISMVSLGSDAMRILVHGVRLSLSAGAPIVEARLGHARKASRRLGHARESVEAHWSHASARNAGTASVAKGCASAASRAV